MAWASRRQQRSAAAYWESARSLQYLLPDDLVVYKDAFLFLFVLAILTLRPQGLFVRQDAWRSRV